MEKDIPYFEEIARRERERLQDLDKVGERAHDMVPESIFTDLTFQQQLAAIHYQEPKENFNGTRPATSAEIAKVLKKKL